jgi:hypothetical protein
MSCWVAPTLAAEIWQISLELLMARIASGEIPVRDEDGFIFVDVAPYGARVERPNRAPHERPAMCTPADPDDTPLMVTDEEAAALTMPAIPAIPAIPQRTIEDEMGPEDDTASKNLGDWRAVRRKTARMRIPPPKPRRLSA